MSYEIEEIDNQNIIDVEQPKKRTIMVDSDGYEIIQKEENYVSPYDLIQKGNNEAPKFLEFALGFNKISQFLQNGFNRFASKEQVFLGRDSLGRPYILENGAATDNPRMKAIKKQYAPLIKEGNNIIAQANNDLRAVRDHLAHLSGERVPDYEAIADMYGVLNSIQGSKIQAIKLNMGAIKDIVAFEHKERELELKEAGGGSGNGSGSGNDDKSLNPMRMFNAIRNDPSTNRNMGNPNMTSEQVEYKAPAVDNTASFDEPTSNTGINKGSSLEDTNVSIFNIASEHDIKKSEEAKVASETKEEIKTVDNNKSYDDFYMDVVDATTSDPDVAINALKLRNGRKETIRMTRDGSYYYLYITDVNGQPVEKFIQEQSIYSIDGVAENLDRENGITSNNWGEKYSVEFIDVSEVPDFIVKQFKAKAGQ